MRQSAPLSSTAPGALVFCVLPMHRALRRAAGLRHGRDHGARGFLVERGIAAADGVEQQQLGLIEYGVGKVLGANGQGPVGKRFDHARALGRAAVGHAACLQFFCSIAAALRPARWLNTTLRVCPVQDG